MADTNVTPWPNQDKTLDGVVPVAKTPQNPHLSENDAADLTVEMKG